jgi:hypothetical protein
MQGWVNTHILHCPSPEEKYHCFIELHHCDLCYGEAVLCWSGESVVRSIGNQYVSDVPLRNMGKTSEVFVEAWRHSEHQNLRVPLYKKRLAGSFGKRDRDTMCLGVGTAETSVERSVESEVR